MKLNHKKKFDTGVAVWVFAALVAIAAYTGASVIYHRTIIDPAQMVGVGVASAILTWLWARRLYAKPLRGLPGIVRFAVHAGLTTGVWMFLYLGVNMWGGSSGATFTEEAEIVEHTRQTRYHQRRVSRHSYRRGEPYTVYKLRLRFPSGKEKDFEVDSNRFRHTRAGMRINVSLKRGLLGYPVVVPTVADSATRRGE